MQDGCVCMASLRCRERACAVPRDAPGPIGKRLAEFPGGVEVRSFRGRLDASRSVRRSLNITSMITRKHWSSCVMTFSMHDLTILMRLTRRRCKRVKKEIDLLYRKEVEDLLIECSALGLERESSAEEEEKEEEDEGES